MEKELYNQLSVFWQKVIDDLVKSLQDVNRFASGNTAQAIGSFNGTPVKFVSADLFEVTLFMPDYYKYIDEGVSGAVNNRSVSQYKYTTKRPPISAIRKFMINRSIVGSDYKDLKRQRKSSARSQSVDKSLNRIAYAIAYKIWRDGLKPTRFYSNVVNDDLLSKFENELLEGYGKLIFDIIDTTTKQ